MVYDDLYLYDVGIINILFWGGNYTVISVSLWSTAGGIVALACETSPDGHMLILRLFPFFGM